MAAWTKAAEKEVVGSGWILDDLLITLSIFCLFAYYFI